MLPAPCSLLIPLRQHLDAHQPYLLFLELTTKLPDGLIKRSALSFLHEIRVNILLAILINNLVDIIINVEFGA